MTAVQPVAEESVLDEVSCAAVALEVEVRPSRVGLRWGLEVNSHPLDRPT
jgi:hypothetical protein